MTFGDNINDLQMFENAYYRKDIGKKALMGTEN